MRRITYALLILFSFSPIIDYLLFQVTQQYLVQQHFWGLLFFIYALILLLNNKLTLKHRYLVFLLPLFIYYTVWKINNNSLFEEGIKSIFKDRVLYIIAMILIIESFQYTDRFIHNMIRIFKITIIIAFVVTIIQIFIDTSFFMPKDRFSVESFYHRRLQSVFGYIDYNALGLSFLPIFSVLIGYLDYNRKKDIIIWIILTGIICFVSNTRYVMAGYVLILSQLFFFKKGIRIRLKFVVFILLTTLSILFFYNKIGYDINEYAESRLLENLEGEQNTRFYVAPQVFKEVFPKNPLFGTGRHVSDEVSDLLDKRSSQIHVGYLSHLVSFGILGSLLLFGFWFRLGRDLYKTARATKYYGVFFAFLMFLWANVTMVHYSIFTYGLTLSLVFNKYFKNNLPIDQYYNSDNNINNYNDQ
ncbi:MAG: O-antigen ligase family protein [Bacteroidales bacterium]|nr:O-antigen ligase family protein [Bacteroidales bacterium]